MPPLPSANGAFLVIQIGNYILAAICLFVTWRESRRLFGLMIGSIFLGYALEASMTTKTPPPYNYTEAIVALPGNVPLGIVLGWGMILFAVWHSLSLLEFGWLRHALAGGLLAVTLDFVTDPAFVHLGFWIWNEPAQYFGIPFSNFIGWFVIVFTFFASLRCVFHFFPPENRATLTITLLGLVAIVPAFLSFIGIMLAYEAVLKAVPILTEPRLVVLCIVPAATYVLYGAAQKAAPSSTTPVRNTLDRMTLLVPAYYLITSATIFLFSEMQAVYPQQAIIYPVLFVVVGLGFYWPLTRRAAQ